MKKLIAITLTLAALTLPAGAASLRPEITVASAMVTLGDIFDGVAEDRADVAVARAPAPGRTLSLDAFTLARLARHQGVDWRPVTDYDRAIITRAARQITAEDIATEAADALRAQAGGEVEIELDNRAAGLALPADAPAGFRLAALSASGGRFSATLIAPAEGPEQGRLPVTGRYWRMIELPVLARDIGRGETIMPRDIDLVMVRDQRLPTGTVREAAEMEGQAARRALRAGQPVPARDLEAPRLVNKGDLVTLNLATPLMQVTARGKALDSGARHDTIRIVNLNSSRIVEATITAAGEATVNP